MVEVGGVLIGLIRCRKMSLFILDRSRHPTLSNTLEIGHFLIKMRFLKKFMVFQKNFFGSKNSQEHSTSDEGI